MSSLLVTETSLFLCSRERKPPSGKKAYKSNHDYDSPTKLESFLAFVVLIYFLLRKTSMKYPQTGDRIAAVT
jgi:hypothetical protein